MRTTLLAGLLLVCSTSLHAQTAEQTVLQMLTGAKNYDSMKVTQLGGCRFKIEDVLPAPTGEFSIIDFSKMREYFPRQLPDKSYLIRMVGNHDFVFWRLRDRKQGGGSFIDSYTNEYEYELSTKEAAAVSTQELKSAEAYFRQRFCKLPM